jgi:hypothetical protein
MSRYLRRFRVAISAVLVGGILGVTAGAFAVTADSGWALQGPVSSTPCPFARAQTVTYAFSSVDFNGGLASRVNSAGCYIWNQPSYMTSMREDAYLYGYDGSWHVCKSFSENRDGDTIFIGQRYYPSGSCSTIGTWGTQSSAYYGLGGDNFFNAWSGSAGW